MPGVAGSSPASTTMHKKGGETPPFYIPRLRVVLRSMVSPCVPRRGGASLLFIVADSISTQLPTEYPDEPLLLAIPVRLWCDVARWRQGFILCRWFGFSLSALR
jgi:hypothetical protein